MLLIADGGSTKCDWVLLDAKGNEILKTRTKGLNPAVFKIKTLENRLQENQKLSNVKDNIRRVDFYGAGCGTKIPSEILKNIVSTHFPNAAVNIFEDMLAAAFAVTTKPGIVCILGTGSNSCYFDGVKPTTFVDSLGYILMDEASGNYFGKKLIQDYFYKRMPLSLSNIFVKHFDLSPDEIKRNLYKEDNPNTYLANFAEFMFTSEDVNDYFRKLISDGIEVFIKNKVLCFEEANNFPIHFVGSIAYFSKEIINELLNSYNLKLGKVVRRPIDGLMEHYRKNVL